MMEGSRCASMDLPVPGGPLISRLCPPAAAISNASRAVCCPFTSRKSGRDALSGCLTGVNAARGSGAVRFRWAATSFRLPAPYAAISGITAACRAFSAGRMNARPACRPCHAIANAPRIGRRLPERANSPASSYRGKSSAATCPEAARMPMAMGRSNRPDSFGKSAGARFTVIFCAGKSKPLCKIAARTRSRLSFTSVSGSPTILNCGSPLARCVSTSTNGASIPVSARLFTTEKAITTPSQ